MTTPTLTTTNLRGQDFSCPSCVTKIEKQVSRVPGVKRVKVHFATARIEVQHDAAQAPVPTLIDAVAKAGFKATHNG